MGKKKILVAEAESIQAAYMQSLLQKNGWEADVVKKGTKVIQKLSEDEYEAVMLNSDLSTCDKGSTIECIRELEKASGKDIPIIGVANYSYDLEKKQFKKAGVEYCLTKPVYKKGLVDMLKSIFRGKNVSIS
ncbi:MAG: response regulator [Flammeovirgaceae bacterium]